MLSPKKVKHRKQQKGNLKGTAHRGSDVSFGDFGLQVTEPGKVTARQIEAARMAITRHVKRAGKLWIRFFVWWAIIIPAFGLIFCRKASTRRDRKNIIASLSFSPPSPPPSKTFLSGSMTIMSGNVLPKRSFTDCATHSTPLSSNVTLICGVMTKLL